MAWSNARTEFPKFDRRTALQMAGLSAAGLALSPGAGSAQDSTPIAADAIPVTGDSVSELAEFDSIMTKGMASWSIPGAELAISRGDRLVYNRGFGYASVEDDEIVQPVCRFRIASTTKPITTIAILMLVDAGELTLDTQVFPLIDFERIPNAPYDARLYVITVEDLLVHAGGWDSTLGMDPQYTPWTVFASHILGAEDPASTETIIRFMLSQPLDFDPGTASVYSNFGFNVLGRVIEHVSGQDYEAFLAERVFAPAGVTSMAIGGTRLEDRLPREVRYYDPPGASFVPSVYPDDGFVPDAYGGFHVPSLDSHGGLISTAEDLIRFALAVDGMKGQRLLSPEIIEVMETTTRPPSSYAGAGNVKDAHGLGWNSVLKDDGYEWSHAGALEGSTASWLVRQPDGTTIAFVANSLPADYLSFFGDLFPPLQQAVADVTDWPEIDLFG